MRKFLFFCVHCLPSSNQGRVWQYALLALVLFLPSSGQTQDEASFEQNKERWGNKQNPDSVRLQAAREMFNSYELGNEGLRTLSQELLAMGASKQSPYWKAIGHLGMGNYYFRAGTLDSARLSFQKSIFQLRDTEDEMLVQLYASTALVFNSETERDSSLHYLLKALDLIERHGYTVAASRVYVNIGAHYHDEGAYLEALNYYGKAKKTDDLYAALNAAMNMGFIFETIGLHEEARTEYLEALDLAKRTTSLEAQVQIYSTAMKVSSSLAEVQSLLEEGLALADSLSLRQPSFYILLEGGIVYLDSLQLDKSEYYLSAAMGVAKSLNNESFQNEALLPLARLDYARGNYASSLQRGQKLQRVLEGAQEFDTLKELYALLSQTFEALSRPDSALYYQRQAEKLSAPIDDIDQAKTLLSAYLKNKAAQENLALKLAKDSAEALAGEALAQKRLRDGFIGLLVVALLAILTFFYLYYRQKRIAEEKLRAINTDLALQTHNLQYSNDKLQRFARVISHDILANLDLVLSSGNILVEDAQLPPPFAKYYDISRRTIGQLKDYSLNLLRDTLTHSEDTAGQDPMPVVRAVLKSYEPLLTERGFRFDIEDLPAIGVPTTVIEQVFQNLISNVIRHAAKGKTPVLRIAAKTLDSQTIWTIEDNGPGVPPEQHATIFENQTPSQSSNGNRIGLSLLKQTLQQYGASISVTNRDGGGARFVIAFGGQP